MSHLSKFANGKKITAGMQIVKVILTQCHDGNAANLLRAIAKSHHGSRMQRSFPEDWQENHGIFEKSGLVTFDGRECPITLKIGASDEEVLPETLVIKDSHGSCCSMKTENGKMVLEIGSTIAPRRIESLASQITGTWIVHGENWRNRANIPFMKPWGDIKKGVYETFSFEVIDGSYENPRPTLRELIHRGCRRSTHVGQWYQRHSTIIPAIVGMPMTMHEFKKEGGVDICMFNGLEIGKNSDIWGPYCSWNESVRHSEKMGMWKDLALSCATPFNFHVHATRTLFPFIQLDSDYLLKEVGQEKLRGIIEVVAAKQPGRFYRLIDEQGITWRQTGVSENLLWYGNDCFKRSEVAENVIQTFLELQKVQLDPAHAMIRKKRLIIDSHAYIVVEAMARGQKTAYELSGRHMHAYLTDGADAKMHRLRNEELFLLLRGFFGFSTMKFHIYPPLTWNSGLHSQYDEKLRFVNKDEWLSQEI